MNARTMEKARDTTLYILFHSFSKTFLCQVTRGDSPVVGARVLVDFTVDLINGTRTKLTQEPIPLLDNGYGGESL